VPSPSWPLLLLPHVQTVPSARSAIRKSPPAFETAIAATFSIADTGLKGLDAPSGSTKSIAPDSAIEPSANARRVASVLDAATPTTPSTPSAGRGTLMRILIDSLIKSAWLCPHTQRVPSGVTTSEELVPVASFPRPPVASTLESDAISLRPALSLRLSTLSSSALRAHPPCIIASSNTAATTA
jgi:hypothetical protein